MRIRLITAFVLALGCAGTVIGLQEQEPQQQRPRVVTGRSKIATKYGIVAASQPLSARAGVQILERGGNAIDAAIAANAVEALVEPYYNGIGGDLFAIYYEAKTGKLYGMNAGGWAPTGLTPELLRSKGNTRMPGSGIYTVTVPGAVKGWEMMRSRFGKLPMADFSRRRSSMPKTDFLSLT
jgi:gamma-glutamyltranspeptidase/glutathione hydrolase